MLRINFEICLCSDSRTFSFCALRRFVSDFRTLRDPQNGFRAHVFVPNKLHGTNLSATYGKALTVVKTRPKMFFWAHGILRDILYATKWKTVAGGQPLFIERLGFLIRLLYRQGVMDGNPLKKSYKLCHVLDIWPAQV